MPIYNENGDKRPIEDIFHPLTKRLLEINFFIEKRNDINLSDEDVVHEIRNHITAYSFDEALANIKGNLTEIENVLKYLKDNKNKFIEKGTWADMPFEDNKAEALIKELENYQSDLSFIYSKVSESQSSYQQELPDINFPKIEMNLTAEQLGGLLYFLLRHQRDIIKTPGVKACEIISKIITIKNSETPSADYLYNMMFKALKNNDVIEFWRKKFNSFYNNPIVKKEKL